MPSEQREGEGIGAAVKQVSTHAVALLKLEGELARLEMTAKLKRYGPAAALGVGALVLALFGLGFALASAAAGLDLALPRWLALLIVAVAVLAVAVALVLGTIGLVKRASPPVPEEAIAEAKETRRVLQEANGRRP